MKRIPCHLFTEEFKKEAARLYKEKGLTLAGVGRNFLVLR
jgi:transposase-like protein